MFSNKPNLNDRPGYNFVSSVDVAKHVSATLKPTVDDFRAEPYYDATESIPETPLFQVYPDSKNTDSQSNSDRASFKAGIRRSDMVVIIDLYARQRSMIGEDLLACFQLLDEIEIALENEQTKPYFGLPGVQGFSWRWERQTFEYGDQKLPYVGARIYLTLKFF